MSSSLLCSVLSTIAFIKPKQYLNIYQKVSLLTFHAVNITETHNNKKYGYVNWTYLEINKGGYVILQIKNI